MIIVHGGTLSGCRRKSGPAGHLTLVTSHTLVNESREELFCDPDAGVITVLDWNR